MRLAIGTGVQQSWTAQKCSAYCALSKNAMRKTMPKFGLWVKRVHLCIYVAGLGAPPAEDAARDASSSSRRLVMSSTAHKHRLIHSRKYEDVLAVMVEDIVE
jgi:hypothetical protein